MALSGLKKKDAPGDAGAGAPVKPAKVVKERRVAPPKAARANGVMVGLNIGNAAIKAVEVTAKNGQLSVTRLASVPTPPDAYQNGNVLSVSALSNAIKTLWKVGGFKGKAVVSSVAGTGALVVRVIEVPIMTDSQLADAMRADAQLYIPFPPTEVQMDFKALRELPRDPDAATMDVLLAAAQSEIIDLHIKVLQGARLDPRAVDVEPIASGRALSLQKRGDTGGMVLDYNEISAIANIGAFGTEISLLRGDVLVFTRTVSAGGNSISQTIADTMGVPLSEGERLKIEQGDALAPEGYGGGAPDDFGFGDSFGDQGGGFGGEFDDFGLSQPASGAAASGGMTTVLDAPPANTTASEAAPASSDPFDLDFFNQGPKDEPGAGHGQKEGEPPAVPFVMDDFDLIPEVSTSQATPSNSSPETKVPTFNFDFDLPPQDLPSAQKPVSASSPSALNVPKEQLPPTARPSQASAPLPSAFDFADFDLPSNDSAATSPSAPPASGLVTPASDYTTPASPLVAPASPLVAPASPLAVPPSPAPEFDLFSTGAGGAGAMTPLSPETMMPARTPEVGGAPASAFADASGAAPASGFAFDSPLETAPAAMPAAPFSSLEPLAMSDEILPDATTGSFAAPLAAETAPSSGGFDLDTVFGGATPSPAGGAETSASLEPSLVPGTVTPVATVSAGGAAPDGLALEGLDVGLGAFDFGGGAEDIGGFGAGLSGGTGDSSSIYGALAPALEELASEIARSLSFYLERVPDAALSRVYLTGGGALLKNIDVYLTGRLGAPTSVFNPLQSLPVSAPASPITTQGPLYTVALGLALRDFVD